MFPQHKSLKLANGIVMTKFLRLKEEAQIQRWINENIDLAFLQSSIGCWEELAASEAVFSDCPKDLLDAKRGRVEIIINATTMASAITNIIIGPSPCVIETGGFYNAAIAIYVSKTL